MPTFTVVKNCYDFVVISCKSRVIGKGSQNKTMQNEIGRLQFENTGVKR